MEMMSSPPQKVCTHQCQSILALPNIEGTIQFLDLYPGAKKNDGDLEVLVAGVAGAVKAASLKCNHLDLQSNLKFHVALNQSSVQFLHDLVSKFTCFRFSIEDTG